MAIAFSGFSIGTCTPLAKDSISNLTTGTTDGDGVLDVLLRTAKAHLQEERDANRITGKEYASAFVALYQATLQSAGIYLVQCKEEEKVAAEAGLLRQRTVTELAQTSNTVNTELGFNTSASVTGLLGEKNELLKLQQALVSKQSDGFDRDAEQKLAKIVADVFSVIRTTDEATTVPSSLSDSSINDIIGKAKTGIGA
jgi:hypothetical protein